MRVVIIGNGVTGISAALRLRKNRPDAQITVISGESKYHYSRPALMYIFMGHMRYPETKPFEDRHWERERIDLVRDWIVGIDTDGRTLHGHSGTHYEYDALLLATGSKPNKFGWPGQDLDGVQGLWGLQDLHTLYETVKRTQHAVIVGGGLIGIELAEMVHSRGIDVTFLVREESYWDNVLPKEESNIINELIREAGMTLHLQTELKEIVSDGHGSAIGVVTNRDERIECQLVGLTAGVSPNVDLVRETSIAVGRGILVDRAFRTETPGVFAAGDCAEIVTPGEARNWIQQVWYTGKRQGELAADSICEQPVEYDPGIWFNSAKFLDLEYQTYGQVNFRVPGEQNIYWQHEDRRHAVRIVHVDGVAIGFNLIGIRWRHEVCERWLAERRTVDYVLDHLADAHFDPEFYTRYQNEITHELRGQLR